MSWDEGKHPKASDGKFFDKESEEYPKETARLKKSQPKIRSKI